MIEADVLPDFQPGEADQGLWVVECVFGIRRNGTGRAALKSRERPVPLRARALPSCREGQRYTRRWSVWRFAERAAAANFADSECSKTVYLGLVPSDSFGEGRARWHQHYWKANRGCARAIDGWLQPAAEGRVCGDRLPTKIGSACRT
jgi:hypothetical protein